MRRQPAGTPTLLQGERDPVDKAEFAICDQAISEL
jgi:hypothetical protein